MASIVLPVPRMSHVGVSVSDLQRSLTFYTQGFGFVEGVHVTVKNNHHALFGVDGDVSMQSMFLRLGPSIIELVEFSSPATTVMPELRKLYHTGLTHLSFRVANEK